jgi:hypothetical protein
LRPDGHVGLVGARFDEAALRSWFASAGVRTPLETDAHVATG